MREDRLVDRFGYLLILTIASIIALGVPSAGLAISVVALGGSSVVALAVSGVSKDRRRVAIGFVVLVAIGTGVTSSTGDGVGLAWGIGMATLSIVAIVAILNRVRTYERVSASVVLAAISIYLFVGITFAGIYAIVDGISDQGFFVQVNVASAIDYVYFSFITMTTVGYGDYTAASQLGKMFAVAEALIGQIYLVTVIALLVSNLGRPRRDRSEGQEPPG